MGRGSRDKGHGGGAVRDKGHGGGAVGDKGHGGGAVGDKGHGGGAVGDKGHGGGAVGDKGHVGGAVGDKGHGGGAEGIRDMEEGTYKLQVGGKSAIHLGEGKESVVYKRVLGRMDFVGTLSTFVVSKTLLGEGQKTEALKEFSIS